jgi:hypothetical protein
MLWHYDCSYSKELRRSTVRLELILNLQSPAVRERILGTIIDGAAAFQAGGQIDIPMPAVLASTIKPG